MLLIVAMLVTPSPVVCGAALIAPAQPLSFGESCSLGAADIPPWL